MTRFSPLVDQTVAVSISESPEMEILGLGPEHLDDAMTEVARHLLSLGARLSYGGDLRVKGFSNLLFELVSKHRRDLTEPESGAGVTNYLAWPVHVGMPTSAIIELSESLKGTADLVCLWADGAVMSLDERTSMGSRPSLSAQDWAEGLTAMRERMLHTSRARVILGGRIANYKGRMPGVAEEALLSLRSGAPLFIIGGFGGCARHIAAALGIAQMFADDETASWSGLDEFSNFGHDDLHNGLSPDEAATMATTPHIDEAVTLLIRGLLRLSSDG